MPIPFLIGAAIVAGITAATGVGAGIKGAVDSHKAKETNESAQDIIENAQGKVNISKKSTFLSLESLGREKVNTFDTTINRFLDTYSKLQNVELKQSQGIDEINKLKIDNNFIVELKKCSLQVSSLLAGGAASIGGGGLAAFGAYSAAMTFGAASTGTAIASLSGIAATNATLAFLGGGSLAAGGLGIAGGTMVLGGLVAGPALAVFGFVFAASASKKLDESYSNYAKAIEYKETSKNIVISTNFIRRRTYMFQRLLIKLNYNMDLALTNLENVIANTGENYSLYNEEQKHCVATNVNLMISIKSVLDTPLLSDNGDLTKESEYVAIAYKKYQ